MLMIYRTHIKYLQSLVRLPVVTINSQLFNLPSENIKHCLLEEYMMNYYMTKQNNLLFCQTFMSLYMLIMEGCVV